MHSRNTHSNCNIINVPAVGYTETQVKNKDLVSFSPYNVQRLVVQNRYPASHAIRYFAFTQAAKNTYTNSLRGYSDSQVVRVKFGRLLMRVIAPALVSLHKGDQRMFRWRRVSISHRTREGYITSYPIAFSYHLSSRRLDEQTEGTHFMSEYHAHSVPSISGEPRTLPQ